MNLILSDVEETIMLVDGTESASPGQGVVNVSPPLPLSQPFPSLHDISGHETKDGNAFRQRRWGYSGAYILFCVCVRLSPLFCLRYRLLHGRNFYSPAHDS